MPFANPDDYQAYRKQYEAANRERIKARKQAYRSNNKDKIREQTRGYREAHKDEIRAYSREYGRTRVRTDKGKFQSGKDNARRRGIPWELAFQDYQPLLRLPCHYCGGPLPEAGSGLDRKENEPYYRLENVLPCCKRCNWVFKDWFSYEEKMILAPGLREIETRRRSLTRD